jgi:hypothetical protein
MVLLPRVFHFLRSYLGSGFVRYSFSWRLPSLLLTLLGIGLSLARRRVTKLAPDGIEMSLKGQLSRQNLRYRYVEQPLFRPRKSAAHNATRPTVRPVPRTAASAWRHLPRWRTAASSARVNLPIEDAENTHSSARRCACVQLLVPESDSIRLEHSVSARGSTLGRR